MIRLVLLATLGACAPKPAPVVAEPAPPPVDPEAWRANRPAAAPAKAWTAPVATQFTLSNGVPVYLVKQGDLPLLSVRLIMKVGRDANGDKAGLAALAANMLDEGTKTRDGAKIAADAAMLGADLAVSPSAESTTLTLDALTGDPLSPSLDLLADVALNPRFDKKDFARVVDEVVTGIVAARAEPRDVAQRTFLAQMYGSKHPYGVPTVGTEASVKALKLADVTRHYADQWHAGNAALVVAGNIDEATLKPLLESRFGKWKVGKAGRSAVTAPSAPLKTRVVFVEQPGAVQSVINAGTVAPSRTTADYWPASVAITLFGGMFSSRLNMNLREEHGWSYGAYAGFADARDYSLLVARSSVQADKTAPAVAEVLKEMGAQAGRVPSPEEMTLVRDYLVKSLPGNFETNASASGTFVNLPLYGLPGDEWAKCGERVTSVTAEQAALAGKSLLDPAKTLVVVAGPRSIEVDDGKGGKTKVDVPGELKALGYEFVELPRP
ncbi:MAG: insulinase family protein [Deltaproteobacteria bacterium]|nr:insulinase family protein [Deltaproteobacteria bacterium]